LRAGNDFQPKMLNALISSLQKVKAEAKSFKSSDEVPVKYQYKNK
jgi:hypothetical protein